MWAHYLLGILVLRLRSGSAGNPKHVSKVDICRSEDGCEAVTGATGDTVLAKHTSANLVNARILYEDGEEQRKNLGKFQDEDEQHPCVTLYRDQNFATNSSAGDWSATFTPGKYNLMACKNMGFEDNEATSIKVTADCIAEVYENDDFTGWSATFGPGNYDAARASQQGMFPRQASSLKVKARSAFVECLAKVDLSKTGSYSGYFPLANKSSLQDECKEYGWGEDCSDFPGLKTNEQCELDHGGELYKTADDKAYILSDAMHSGGFTCAIVDTCMDKPTTLEGEIILLNSQTVNAKTSTCDGHGGRWFLFGSINSTDGFTSADFTETSGEYSKNSVQVGTFNKGNPGDDMYSLDVQILASANDNDKFDLMIEYGSDKLYKSVCLSSFDMKDGQFINNAHINEKGAVGTHGMWGSSAVGNYFATFCAVNDKCGDDENDFWAFSENGVYPDETVPCGFYFPKEWKNCELGDNEHRMRYYIRFQEEPEPEGTPAPTPEPALASEPLTKEPAPDLEPTGESNPVPPSRIRPPETTPNPTLAPPLETPPVESTLAPPVNSKPLKCDQKCEWIA